MTTTDLDTNTLGTEDWLETTKHLTIRSYTAALEAIHYQENQAITSEDIDSDQPITLSVPEASSSTTAVHIELDKLQDWANHQLELAKDGSLSLEEVKSRYGL